MSVIKTQITYYNKLNQTKETHIKVVIVIISLPEIAQGKVVVATIYHYEVALDIKCYSWETEAVDIAWCIIVGV